MEMFPDDDADPCEVYFSDYREVDGRWLPGRMEVRYGDETFAMFKLEKFNFEKAAKNDARSQDRHAIAKNAMRSRANVRRRPWQHRVDCIAAIVPSALPSASACVLLPSLPAVRARAAPSPSPTSSTRSSRRWSRSTAPAASAAWRPTRAACSISPEGHILTVFSYVLDTDYITVVLADGRKFEAKLLGADPRLEVAVLKIEAAGPALLRSGARRSRPTPARACWPSATCSAWPWATSRPACSTGSISVVTELEARRGVFETPYRGPVYVLDVMTNNPGAAGGALVTRRGELIGMLGKELRNALNNTWLNYAVPIDELRAIGRGDPRRQVRRPRAKTDASKKPARSLDLAIAGHRAGARRAGAHAALRRPRAARLAGRQGRASGPTT